LPQAIELSEECAALLREELGPNHPDTLSARNILFGAYMAASRFEDAFGLSEETLQLTRERLDAEPQNSLALAGSLANHAQVLLRLEDWEKAESVLRECLEIREQHSPESWLTFNIRCVLGGVLLQLDKCEEAEPLLLDGYRGMHLRESAIPQDGKERLREAILSLVKLYETKDIPEEAAHWRAKLDETQGRQDPPAPERESPLPSAESTGQQKAAAPESSEQGQGNATMHTEPAQP
jgi:tetratricopeptide (TPR) repeat protein